MFCMLGAFFLGQCNRGKWPLWRVASQPITVFSGWCKRGRDRRTRSGGTSPTIASSVSSGPRGLAGRRWLKPHEAQKRRPNVVVAFSPNRRESSRPSNRTVRGDEGKSLDQRRAPDNAVCRVFRVADWKTQGPHADSALDP